MARVGLWMCLALLALLATGSALWFSSLELPSGAAAPGVRVAGAAIAPGEALAAGANGPAQALEAVVRELSRRVESVPVRFTLASGEGAADLSDTLGGVGIGVDMEATLRRARSIGRRGSPILRWQQLEVARTQGIDVPLELSFDRPRFFQRLAAFKQYRDRAPQPARFPMGARALAPHVAGRYLDLERAGDAVWALASTRADGAGTAPAVVARIDIPMFDVAVLPRVNTEALPQFEPKHALSEYATRFRVQGDQATRAANIGVAASRLDGVILMPGDRMSFNDVVGERSVENGFLDSWEILDGEFVRGVGGGTCQVSSTLNAAAVRGGLRIVEAYTHSRPLAYIEKGLDATVAWPFVDLKLENTWPVPVAIQAKVSGNTITVRLLAESSPGRVAVRSEVKETVPFPRVVEVGRAPSGSFKLKQAGIPGFRIQRTRFIWPRDGEMRREVVFKRYRPTPELFLVSPGFDESELPPLPEGAEGYDPLLDPMADPATDPTSVPDFPGAEPERARSPLPVPAPDAAGRPPRRVLTGT